MNPELRKLVIQTLEKGEELPAEWARELFPPEKREMELTYFGKEREEDVMSETMAIPLQAVSTFGKNGTDWHNFLVFGDNLQALKRLLQMKNDGQLKSADGTPGVRLVYIDPPFGTGDEYGHNDAEVAYSAKLQGALYVEFLRKRLILLRELLSDDGTIYIRTDYHFSHYVRVVLDEVFGPGSFLNELVINRFKRQLRGLKKHNVSTDSLFVYSKSPNRAVFNEQFRTRLCSFCGQEKEPEWHDMISSGLRNPPDRIIMGRKLLPPRGQHWKYTQVKIDEMEAQGRIRIEEGRTFVDLAEERITGMPQFLQTEDSVVDSDWTDLRGYALNARYPTENHEELLARVINTSSNEGDLVLDAFAGSGTTLAVSEKLGRRWIGIDCGKLSIYTIQKRMLNLKSGIGNTGRALQPRAFTVYNCGLYDFSTLRRLPWQDWRFFALQLFGVKDEPHDIAGLRVDGKLGGASVLVFDHLKQHGARIDEQTIRQIHTAVGKRIGRKFFIIAPRGVFDFQQDYLDFDNVRYYALRIPYSIINELHHREFSALRQPANEQSVNETVDAVGFDFIQPPVVEWHLSSGDQRSVVLDKFTSQARIKGKAHTTGLESLSMVLCDWNFDGKVFDLDTCHFSTELVKKGMAIPIPAAKVGDQVMLVFMDVFGNEARVVLDGTELQQAKSVAASRAKKGTVKRG